MRELIVEHVIINLALDNVVSVGEELKWKPTTHTDPLSERERIVLLIDGAWKKRDNKGEIGVVIKDLQDNLQEYGLGVIKFSASGFQAPSTEFVEVKICLNALL